MERVVDGVRYRIQSEPFNMMDYEAIERHLEEMAADGWIFKGFEFAGWEYTEKEIQKITDNYTKEIETICDAKQKEIMSI